MGDYGLQRDTHMTADGKSSLFVFTEHTWRPHSRPLTAHRPRSHPLGATSRRSKAKDLILNGPPKPHTVDPRVEMLEG